MNDNEWGATVILSLIGFLVFLFFLIDYLDTQKEINDPLTKQNFTATPIWKYVQNSTIGGVLKELIVKDDGSFVLTVDEYYISNAHGDFTKDMINKKIILDKVTKNYGVCQERWIENGKEKIEMNPYWIDACKDFDRDGSEYYLVGITKP